MTDQTPPVTRFQESLCFGVAVIAIGVISAAAMMGMLKFVPPAKLKALKLGEEWENLGGRGR